MSPGFSGADLANLVNAAALMAAELSASCSDATGQQITVEPAAMQKVLEKHVRAHLDELAEVRPDFR